MVDGRFVLKITDYGFNELLESQKAPIEEPPPEGTMYSLKKLFTLRSMYSKLCRYDSKIEITIYNISFSNVVLRWDLTFSP